MQHVADAIRKITARMQHLLDCGERSSQIDANDLIDLLLAVADEIDPQFVDHSHSAPE